MTLSKFESDDEDDEYEELHEEANKALIFDELYFWSYIKFGITLFID